MNDVMISDMEHAPRPICRHLARKFGMFSCNLLGMKVPCARILAMKRSSFIKIVFDSGPCALKEKHIYIYTNTDFTDLLYFLYRNRDV